MPQILFCQVQQGLRVGDARLCALAPYARVDDVLLRHGVLLLRLFQARFGLFNGGLRGIAAALRHGIGTHRLYALPFAAGAVKLGAGVVNRGLVGFGDGEGGGFVLRGFVQRRLLPRQPSFGLGDFGAVGRGVDFHQRLPCFYVVKIAHQHFLHIAAHARADGGYAAAHIGVVGVNLAYAEGRQAEGIQGKHHADCAGGEYADAAETVFFRLPLGGLLRLGRGFRRRFRLHLGLRHGGFLGFGVGLFGGVGLGHFLLSVDLGVDSVNGLVRWFSGCL